MCPRHLVVNRAAAMGVDVQKTICDNGCPLRSECGFQAQKTAIPDNSTGLFVMAADYLWLPCPAPRHDLAIVDESIIGKAAEIVSFDPSRIIDDQKWAGGELEEAMERRRIAPWSAPPSQSIPGASWRSCARTASLSRESGPASSISPRARKHSLI
jgi:hypothetical protein